MTRSGVNKGQIQHSHIIEAFFLRPKKHVQLIPEYHDLGSFSRAGKLSIGLRVEPEAVEAVLLLVLFDVLNLKVVVNEIHLFKLLLDVFVILLHVAED